MNDLSEFLNNIKLSCIPNHKPKLKVGVPIMLLRNIDQTNGLLYCKRLQMNIGEKIFTP